MQPNGDCLTETIYGLKMFDFVYSLGFMDETMPVDDTIADVFNTLLNYCYNGRCAYRPARSKAEELLAIRRSIAQVFFNLTCTHGAQVVLDEAFARIADLVVRSKDFFTDLQKISSDIVAILVDDSISINFQQFVIWSVVEDPDGVNALSFACGLAKILRPGVCIPCEILYKYVEFNKHERWVSFLNPNLFIVQMQHNNSDISNVNKNEIFCRGDDDVLSVAHHFGVHSVKILFMCADTNDGSAGHFEIAAALTFRPECLVKRLDILAFEETFGVGTPFKQLYPLNHPPNEMAEPVVVMEEDKESAGGDSDATAVPTRGSEAEKDKVFLSHNQDMVFVTSFQEHSPPAPGQLCTVCKKDHLLTVLCIDCPCQRYMCSKCDDAMHERAPLHNRFLIPSPFQRLVALIPHSCKPDMPPTLSAQYESLKPLVMASLAAIEKPKEIVDDNGNVIVSKELCYRVQALDRPCCSHTCRGCYYGYKGSFYGDETSVSSVNSKDIIQYVTVNGTVELFRGQYECNNCNSMYYQSPALIVKQSIFPFGYIPGNSTGSVMVAIRVTELAQTFRKSDPGLATATISSALSKLGASPGNMKVVNSLYNIYIYIYIYMRLLRARGGERHIWSVYIFFIGFGEAILKNFIFL